MAVSRLILTRRIVDTVLAGQTKIVDQIQEGSVFSIEYHINMRKNDNTESKTIKVIVDTDDTSIRDTVWSRIGQLNVLVNLQKDSGYIKLQLQNNEAFDVNIKVIRQLT